MKLRKVIFILLTFLMFTTGCSNKMSEKEINEQKTLITNYVQKSMGTNWSYTEDKLQIDNELNVIIKMYNSEDYVYCFDNSKTFAKKLKDNYSNELKIKRVSFVCQINKETSKVGTIEIENIKDVDFNDYENYVKIFDENDEVLNKKIDEYRESLKQDYINDCKTYNYKEIFRNSDEYLNKHAKFTGEVIQVYEEDGYYSIRINITKDEYGYYEDTILAYTPVNVMKGRILEGDVLTIYGRLVGIETYESIFGQAITIPAINVRYLTLNN